MPICSTRPSLHNTKTVRDRHRLFLIMGYVNESMIELALQAIEFDSHLLSQSSVKSRDRLIHQICFRITYERPPDGNALSLAARKVCRKLVEQVSYMKRFGNLRYSSQ